MTQTTTRRGLLRMGTSVAAYGAGAALVAGGCALAGEAKGATPAVSPELTRLIAEFDDHDAKLSAFYRATFNPAVERHREFVEALPHREIDGSLAGDGRRMWSTANRMDVAEARGIATMPTSGQSITPLWLDKRRRARSFYAASLRRQRAIDRAERDTGAFAAGLAEDERLGTMRLLREGIYGFAVTGPADLAAKLAFIERTDGMEGEDLLPLMLADARRLCGEA